MKRSRRKIPEVTQGVYLFRYRIGSPDILGNWQLEMKIAVYGGKGAVLAQDVIFALKKLSISPDEICASEIKKGKLANYPAIIIPGGKTEEYVKSLIDKGFKNIRKFIKKGGGYIGICAGAYLASSRVEIAGRPFGLGIIDIQNIRENNLRRPGRVRSIKIENPHHPVTKSYSGKIGIWYQNGPLIKAGRVLGLWQGQSGDF